MDLDQTIADHPRCVPETAAALASIAPAYAQAKHAAVADRMLADAMSRPTVFVGNELRNRPATPEELSPLRGKEVATKSSATAVAGSPDIPMVAMAQTDDAISRGERCDISIALAAERRAWIAYADRMARGGAA